MPLTLLGCVNADLLGRERVQKWLSKLKPDAVSVEYDTHSIARIQQRSGNASLLLQWRAIAMKAMQFENPHIGFMEDTLAKEPSPEPDVGTLMAETEVQYSWYQNCIANPEPQLLTLDVGLKRSCVPSGGIFRQPRKFRPPGEQFGKMPS